MQVIKARAIERRSPSLSGGPPWDLISEKLCIEVNGERKIIFRFRLNCATHMMFVNLKDNFASKKKKTVS